MPPSTPRQLVASLLGGSSQAAARLISLLENDGADAAEILQAIFPFSARAYVVGVTGPPGSGKSTLVNQAIRALRAQGQRVGVVAVDPTSPFTGGALLGDRIRMQDHSTDPDVFVRSMATRGNLGGLAPATDEAVAVLAAWGAATILIETVGTGQAEVDVVSAADTVIVVTAPGLGDGVQMIKAGVMEIGDVFVVNKADRPEADHTVSALRSTLSLIPGDRWKPPVLPTVATTGDGIADMLVAMTEHRRYQESTGLLHARRRDRWRRDILRTAEAMMREQWLGAGAALRLDDLAGRVAGGALDPHAAAGLLLAPHTPAPLPAPQPELVPGPPTPEPETPRLPWEAPESGGQCGDHPGVQPPPRRSAVWIDHIGVAVRNLEEAGRFYQEVLGIAVGEPVLVLEDGLAAAFVTLGETRIELLEPATIDGPIARFIERRGGGIHHIALAVPDVARALEHARAAGYTLVDQEPRLGADGARIAFLHPKTTHGVLIELVDHAR
jgi:LAO/AO transport system kinase